ncbi:protein transport protein Sec24C-like isoform X2 [Ambystoma mexicanum]|uniref:protein transport protein Sec24C-like isoform X2 n=1 Tax=Ambystoma mexicanum TaxID=8296 RepID=UPI0037E95E9C
MLHTGVYGSPYWLSDPDRGSLIARDPGGAPSTNAAYALHPSPAYVHFTQCPQDGSFNMWTHGGTVPPCAWQDVPKSPAFYPSFSCPSTFPSSFSGMATSPSLTPHPAYGYSMPVDAWPYPHPSAPAWPVHSQVEQKALLGRCTFTNDFPSWDTAGMSRSEGPYRSPTYQYPGPVLPFLDPAVKAVETPPPQEEVRLATAKSLQSDGDLSVTPSVVRAIEDDKLLWESQVFVTDVRGQIPPLTSTHFTVEDQGNASPRFIRCTTYTLPATAQLAEVSHLPLAAIVKPLAILPPTEAPPPLAEGVTGGPVQCGECGALVCPFMRFVEAGQRLHCGFCSSLSEVPWQYYVPTDREGRRSDHQRRPELCRGSYEFLLADVLDTDSHLPAFIFLIDVSQDAVQSGLVQTVCEELKVQLCSTNRDSRNKPRMPRVGILTYDRTVHFYNLNSRLTQPQMLVLTDPADVEVPLREGLLVCPSESRDMLISLLDGIPGLFSGTEEREAVFTPAIRAGLESLKVCDCPGKIFMFHSSIPTVDRKLQLCSSPQSSTWSKEKSVFHPRDTVSELLGLECTSQGCGLDLFLCPRSPCSDMATFGYIPGTTGGILHNYGEFQVEIDGKRLLQDLRRAMEKEMGFNAQVKISTTKGLMVSGFMLPSGLSSSGDLKMAYTDCDQSFAVEFKPSSKLSPEEGVYLQFALYYTSQTGQRKLRVHNIHLNCSERLVETFQQSQAEALLSYFSKSAYSAILQSPLKEVRDALVTRLTQILACYRQQCAASCMSDGQLVMPQFLKALPICLNALRKSEVLLPGLLTTVDERAWLRQAVLSMDVRECSTHFYPRILPLHQLWSRGTALPRAVRCSEKALSPNGIYLAENRLTLLLWVGPQADPDVIQNLFGVARFSAVCCGSCALPVLDNPLSDQARRIIETLQTEGARTAKLLVVKPGEEMEKLFKMLLEEDKSPNGGASYKDFLCHIHLSIQQLLRQ